MGFDYQSFENGHVLAIRTEDVLTLEDIHNIDFVIRNHCHRTQGEVHVIVDLKLTETFPRNVVDLKHELNWVREINVGWVIFLSENRYLNMLIDAAMHVSGQSYLMMDDFDAAMNLVCIQYEPVL